MANTTEITIEDSEDEEKGENSKQKKVFVKKKILDDEEWFEAIGPKELKHYKKNMISEDKMDENKVVCTACFRQMNHKIPGMVSRHPDLGVPVCKQCKKFYRGEWTRDEEGYFEFCRWCANGGDLLLCDCCSNVFCKKCIKRNLGRSKVSEIEDLDEWKCLVCEPSQIWKQRAMYYSVYIYLKNQKSDDENLSSPEKKDMSTEEIEFSMQEPLNFMDSTFRDCFDAHKILGNYIDRAKKSWSKKRYSDHEREDIIKATVKLRTIFNITHHNLKLLDQNLVYKCQNAVPGTKAIALKVSNIPGLTSTESDMASGADTADTDSCDPMDSVEITPKEEDTEMKEVEDVEDVKEVVAEDDSVEGEMEVDKTSDLDKNKHKRSKDDDHSLDAEERPKKKKKNIRTPPEKSKKVEASEIDANEDKAGELDTSTDMLNDSGDKDANSVSGEIETVLDNGIEHAKGDVILDTRKTNKTSSTEASPSDKDESLNKENDVDNAGEIKASDKETNKSSELSAQQDDIATDSVDKNDNSVGDESVNEVATDSIDNKENGVGDQSVNEVATDFVNKKENGVGGESVNEHETDPVNKKENAVGDESVNEYATDSVDKKEKAVCDESVNKDETSSVDKKAVSDESVNEDETDSVDKKEKSVGDESENEDATDSVDKKENAFGDESVNRKKTDSIDKKEKAIRDKSENETGEQCDENIVDKEADKVAEVSSDHDASQSSKSSDERERRRAANLAAKASVLMTSSSDDDTLQHDIEEDVSPRKRLKTKKEFDQIRRQSGNEENDSGSSNTDSDSDDLKEVPSTPKSKVKKKPESNTDSDSDDSEDTPSATKSKGKKKLSLNPIFSNMKQFYK